MEIDHPCGSPRCVDPSRTPRPSHSRVLSLSPSPSPVLFLPFPRRAEVGRPPVSLRDDCGHASQSTREGVGGYTQHATSHPASEGKNEWGGDCMHVCQTVKPSLQRIHPLEPCMNPRERALAPMPMGRFGKRRAFSHLVRENVGRERRRFEHPRASQPTGFASLFFFCLLFLRSPSSPPATKSP